MQYLIRIMLIIGFFSASQPAYSGSITDTYTSGDTLTAAMLDNIKAAVNDNDTTVDFDSRISYRIPVFDATALNTVVEVFLVNTTSTTCDVYVDERIDVWSIGANAKSGLFLLPTYIAVTMPGVTGSIFSPPITTTIVAHTNMTADVSKRAFVDILLTRNETHVSDTCNVGDIEVRGALVTYPGPTIPKYFVPVEVMNVL